MYILIFLKIVNFSFNWTQKVYNRIARIRSYTDRLIDRQLGPFPLIHRKSYASSRRRIFHKQCCKPKLQVWFGLMLYLYVSKCIWILSCLNSNFNAIITFTYFVSLRKSSSLTTAQFVSAQSSAIHLIALKTYETTSGTQY